MNRTTRVDRKPQAARPRPASTDQAGDRDLLTKERLLKEATQLFSERGFQKVTVREICSAAHTNVAAVNYHFGGKHGLYEAVLQIAIRIMRATTEEITREGQGKPAAERLRIYIRVFLQRIGESQNGWIHQLMVHELRDPTPALDMVMDGVVKPRLAYLASMVAELLRCRESDPRVMRCVTSIQAQCMVAVRNNPIGEKLGLIAMTPEQIPTVASHIAAFSLAGVQALRRKA